MAKQWAETCESFANACNEALGVAVQQNIANNIKLHHACYTDIRKNHGLSANLAVRAIRRVSAAMTTMRGHVLFVRAMRRYLFHVPLVLGNYQREALRGSKPTAAALTRSRNGFSIHIVIEETDALPPGDGTMGVDCGIRYTVATNFGMLHKGQSRRGSAC